jgi:hypothetical protein
VPDSPRRPEWWTAADDEGATYPPGFVSEFLRRGADGPVLRRTYRYSRKARIFSGRLRTESGDLVVRPFRRGKFAADALRAAVGESDVVVRTRPSGRPPGWRTVEIETGRVAVARLISLLCGEVVSEHAACRTVSMLFYGDESRADSLARSCRRWRARSAGASDRGQ